MIDHQNRFYGVFGKRGVRPTSCFLSDQKISILAKVIAGQRSAPIFFFSKNTIKPILMVDHIETPLPPCNDFINAYDWDK